LAAATFPAYRTILFVQRPLKKRRVANYAQLLAAARLRFRPRETFVEFHRLPAAHAQWRAFSATSIIVAPHGAALVVAPRGAVLVNMLFAAPSTRVIEFMPGALGPNYALSSISAALGLEHHIFFCVNATRATAMTVVVDEVVALLAAMLAAGD
jgi:hypothetical protein